MREQIPEANKRIGAISSHDISLPLSAIPEFPRRGAGAVVAGLGRVPDQRLRPPRRRQPAFQRLPAGGRARDPTIRPTCAARVATAIYDLVAEFDGSFSAEHGIGRLKVADLERYGDPAKLAAMRAIKAALDPHGIMNPGAMLAG